MSKMSITTKLSLFVLAVGIITATGATILVWRYTSDKIQTILQEKLLDDSSYIATIIETKLEYAYTITHHMSLDQTTGEVIATHDRNRINKHFNNHNLGNQFLSLYFINNDGIITYSTDPSFVGLDVSAREYYQDVQNDLHTIATAIGLRSGELGYYTSHKLTNTHSASDSGVIAGKFNPDHISALISSTPINAVADVSIVDRFGTILDSTNPSLEMHNLGTLSDQDLEEIKTYKLYPSIPASLGYDEVKQHINTYKAPKLFTHKKGRNKQYITLTKIGDQDLYIVLTQNSQNINQTIRNMSIILIAISASATALGFLAIWKMTDGSLKPIQQIKKAAESIAAGNYDVVINSPKTGDELESIATDMSTMIKTVKSSHQALDETVKARTKELSDRLEELEKFKRLTVKRELKMVELKKELARLQNDARKNLET